MDISDVEHGFKADSWEWRRVINCVPYGESVEAKEAICCPEDVKRHPYYCKHDKHILCKHCSAPICLECWSRLISPTGYKTPAALANDNFQGYCHPFLVRNKVRWIEAVTACPFFLESCYLLCGRQRQRTSPSCRRRARSPRACVCFTWEYLLLYFAMGIHTACCCQGDLCGRLQVMAASATCRCAYDQVHLQRHGRGAVFILPERTPYSISCCCRPWTHLRGASP